MAFEEQLPEWEAEGTQPPKTKRMEGWNPAEKPPASWFNWLFHRTYKALQELQQKAAEKVDVQVAQQIAQQAEQTAQQAVQTASQTAGALASHLNETAQNHVHGLSPERVRAIYVSTDDPDDEIGEDGDIWIKYEE